MRLPGDERQLFSTASQLWQLTDLQALDTAWKELARHHPPHPDTIRRSYIERPRGHSKTSDMALQLAWILLFAKRPVNGLAAAADRDQANFIHDSLKRLASVNEIIFEDLAFIQHRVKNRNTGSRLDIISSDAKSSFGALPDFVVCDEICHWEKPDLWYSLLSSAAKKPDCVLTVLTNAGVGRGWQWDLREHARTDPRWHFSSLAGPHAPWITDDWLAEQRALLPEPVFERLWLNIWQHSDGNFITLAEAEACRDESLFYQATGITGISYVATIDYAEKHDFTVGCVCHKFGDTIIVDRMDVVKPSPSQPTKISWVENWIENIAACFHNVRFIVDEYQLLGTIQKLEQRFPISRFQFRGSQGNHKLALLLRTLLLQQNMKWYPDCGRIPEMQRDDLETELSSLLLKQSASGNVRIDHIQDQQHHDDRAFALGVACLALNEEQTSDNFFYVTPPSQDGSFTFG